MDVQSPSPCSQRGFFPPLLHLVLVLFPFNIVSLSGLGFAPARSLALPNVTPTVGRKSGWTDEESDGRLVSSSRSSDVCCSAFLPRLVALELSRQLARRQRRLAALLMNPSNASINMNVLLDVRTYVCGWLPRLTSLNSCFVQAGETGQVPHESFHLGK